MDDYSNVGQISILANLLAGILQPPRFVGARRKLSDKTGNVLKYSTETHMHGLKYQLMMVSLLTACSEHL